MQLAISYSKRSCKTGRRLYEALRQRPEFNRVKRVRNDNRVPTVDVHIRWGNSTSVGDGSLTINTPDAVRNASNKFRMMEILKRTAGVNTPKGILRGQDYTEEELDSLKNEDGQLFVRGSNMSVRYDTTFTQSDHYCTTPIDKDKEYRVHVFNGKVVAVYEKIPNDGEEALIRKDANCRFSKRRHDEGDPTCNADAQAMCIRAVQALGLVFGGVDLIRDKTTKKFYVVEINSSPALNTPNIERYVDEFIKFINDPTIVQPLELPTEETVEEVVEDTFDRMNIIRAMMRVRYDELKSMNDDELMELCDE